MHPTRDDYLQLLLLGAVWGSSFLLIKLAVETIPPITVAAARIAIGAIVLALIVAARSRSWPRGRRQWLLLFVMGLVGNIIPFSLINWGETRIDSGLTAILMSTVPLATIMLAPAFVRDEPVTSGKLVGATLGMAGVAVLIGPGALMGAHGELHGEIAVTCAAQCDAANRLVARQLIFVTDRRDHRHDVVTNGRVRSDQEPWAGAFHRQARLAPYPLRGSTKRHGGGR
jgi:drug/metabolite transporter (DMT)-like permease